MSGTGRCSKCGATIVWLRTRNGKWMPTDAGPKPYKLDPEGKDYVVTDCGDTVRCNLTFQGIPTGTGRTPHWTSCPHAREFRKKK